MPRWSTLLGERRAADLNTWCSVIFLAIPLLAGAAAFLSWGWKFLRAACAQILGRQPNQQPIASILVLGALTLGLFAVGAEVGTLWPGAGASDDFHWPLRLMVTWAAVVLLSGVVRRFLVQYLGDVTAYVDAHTVDRFADLRSRIKECVTDRARAVYAATGNDEYAAVVVVGHSLGSVVSFDVLNQLLCEDAIKRQAGNPGLDVARRTPPSDLRLATRQDGVHLRDSTPADHAGARGTGGVVPADDSRLRTAGRAAGSTSIRRGTSSAEHSSTSIFRIRPTRAAWRT